MDRLTERRVAWLVAVPAGLVSAAAFLLWGFSSTDLVIGMIAAYCL
jgi:hypothetical protein